MFRPDSAPRPEVSQMEGRTGPLDQGIRGFLRGLPHRHVSDLWEHPGEDASYRGTRLRGLRDRDELVRLAMDDEERSGEPLEGQGSVRTPGHRLEGRNHAVGMGLLDEGARRPYPSALRIPGKQLLGESGEEGAGPLGADLRDRLLSTPARGLRVRDRPGRDEREPRDRSRVRLRESEGHVPAEAVPREGNRSGSLRPKERGDGRRKGFDRGLVGLEGRTRPEPGEVRREDAEAGTRHAARDHRPNRLVEGPTVDQNNRGRALWPLFLVREHGRSLAGRGKPSRAWAAPRLRAPINRDPRA